MELANMRQDLVGWIEQLPADRQPRWGQLRAPALITHLDDTLQVALQEKPLAYSVPMPGFLMRWLVIWNPMPWPKGVKAPPAFFESEPAEFQADKERLLANLDRVLAAKELLNPHPAFGRMRLRDWDHLLARHFRHHMKQFS